MARSQGAHGVTERLAALLLAMVVAATSGVLDAGAIRAAEPDPSPAATEQPAEPDPTAGPTSEPEPTERPTPEPTEEPTPEPTPEPEPTEAATPAPEPSPAAQSPEPAPSDALPDASPVTSSSPVPSASVEASALPSATPTPEPSAAPTPEPTATPEPFPTPGPTEEPPGEVVPELRDASTITYLAPDGTYITDTFAGPMWYVEPTEPPSEGSATSALAQEVAPDASGAPAPSSVPGEPEPAPTPLPVWLPIEPGFAEPEDDGRLVSAHAPVRVVLDPSSASEPFLSLRADGARVDWYLPQGAAAGVAPARDPSGRAADYHDVLPGGADLRVFPHADGAKTFIVLDAPPTSNRWEFPVEAPGLTLVEDDGAVRLVDDEGRSQGRVPDPFAVDSTFVEGLGSGRFSGDVAISVGQAGGRQTLIITVDPGFLGDATYPVYIDPTTIVPDDDGGAYDTFAAEGYPNDEFYAYQRPDAPGYYELWLGKSPDHPNDQNYPHIKFSGYLGTLGTVHVIKAELQVRPYHQYKSPTGTRIRRITDPWTSSTLNWNNRPSTTDMATGDSVKISTSEDKTASFIVTKAVQAFVDGTLTDNGFRLDNQSNGYTHWKRLIAADQGGSLSPKLRIVWYAPSATPSAPTGGASTASRTLAWTYSDGYSGVTNPQSHYQVQVSSNSGFSSIIADSTTLNGATDLVGPATSWTIPGSVTLTASTTYYWRVRAKDGSIWSPWSGGASFVFTVPPVFGDIAAPSEGGVAKGVITVTGTAAGASFTSYTLKYQVGCTPGGTLVDIGTNPRTSAVTNGTLGTWDTTTPTALADGQYLVVLTVAYATNVVVNRCVSLDTTSPVGSLAIGYSPDDLVRIDGTAYDAAPGGFSDYVLEYAAGESPGSGWALVDGSVSAYLQPRTGTEVDDAGVLLPLATWDTSALSPGLYTVRLTVHDRLANAPAVVSQVVLLGEPRRGSSDGGSEHTFAVGPDWTLGVGVADGELSLSRTLFTIPSYGAPQTMSIHYASGDADDDGLLGTGWSSDLTQRLEEVGSAVVVWHTADGSLLPYAWNGSAFVPPVGRFETLTHDVGNARYVLADPDGSYMRFADSGDGRLLAMCGRFDQCLDLAWGGSSVTATDESNRTTTLTLSSGRIATAVDSAGRDWAFTYTSGRLTEIVDPVGSDIDLTYGGSGGELTRVTAHRGGDVNWDIGYSSGVVTWVQDPIADGLGSTWRSDIVMDAADDTTVVKELETHTGSVAQARTEYTIDDDDLPVATEVESGATTTVTYDEHDLPATITNGSQGTTSVTYVDETGAVEREVAPGPDGPVTSEYAYEAGTTDVNSIVVKDDANAVIQETTQSCDHGELDSTTVDPGPGNLALTTSYTYTTRHQLRTETSPGGVVTRYEYDYDTNSGDPGNMTARVDNYVSSQSATSSRNVRTEYTYDPAGNVASETDPRGIVTTYAYDNLGRQTSATRNDVSGSSSDGDKDLIDETWYDSLGYVAATRDPRGTVTRHVTDAMGRETRTIVNCTDSGTTPTSTPTTCTGGGTHDASTNVVTDMTYDARGSLLSSTIRHQSDSSKDVRTEHTYDDAGNRTITVVDAGSGKLALTTRTAYDDLGNAIAEFDPLGTTTVRDYDAGNVVEEIRNCTTDSTGTITGMSSGNFASCDGSGTANATWNVTTTNDYDDLGQLVTEVASNLRKTTTSYDDAGRVTSVVDNDVASPSGNEDLETTYAYDDDGNQTGVRAPTSSRTTFGVTRTVYDELGRVTSVTASCTSSGTTVPSSPACTAAGTADASHNITTTTAYDAVGNVLSLEMPDPAAGTGSTTTITTRYAYDGAGRLCRVLENASTDLQGLADPCTSSVTSTSDGNVSTRYGYDKAGNLVTATDAEGSTQTYAFDRLGRMTSRTDGLGATESWSYDVRGNRLTLDGRIAGSSDLVTWTYDAADRMLTRVADGNTTSYGYDANGNMTSAAVAAETISVTYDRLDRPLLVTPGSGATTEYGYTSFTLLERDDPSGALDFGLDKWGRQTTMKVGATTVDTVAWRPDGLVASSANVDGNTNARTYDAAGRLTEIRLAAGGTTRADIDYTYNRAGLARTEATASINAAVNGTASFAYDHLGRLTGYDSPMASAADRDYAWKRVASRSSVTSDPSGTPSTLTYTLDAADRITADSASGTYGTDASGRVTARPSRQFVWNSLGRLTTVKDGSGTTITTYTYDALDRVRSYTSSGTTWILRYVGTTSSIALVRDDTAGTTERLLLNDLAGQPWGYLSASGTGRVSWLLNAHHDTVATYDSSGALGRYYRYTPDGAFAASGGTGATPTTRFQSSWYDGTTGLYWVVSRWYDPATARFLSEDSLLGEPSNPDSRHRYAYGEGDPVNAWDPDGRARLKLAHVRIESRIYDCCNIQLTRALLVVSWHYDGRRITDYRGTMTATYHREAGYFTGWSLGSKRTYDRCLRHHIGGCASRGLGFVAEFNYFGIFTPGLPWATHHNVHRAAVVIRGNGTHTWEAGVQYRDTFFWHWRIYYNGRLVRHGSA